MRWPEPAASASAQEAAFEAALIDFVRQHHGRLIRLAGLICRDVTDSEDAVQSGLERAWRARGTLRDSERMAAWLDRIVVREAIRLSGGTRRLRWLSRRGSEDEAQRVLDAVPAAPGDAVGASVTSRLALRSAFEGLPPDQRAVVALHLYEGYTMPETAEIVGVPLETARSRLRLAKERLRAALAEGRT